jgi:hypothetical protein
MFLRREGDLKGWSTVLATAMGSVLGKPSPAAIFLTPPVKQIL